MPLPPALAARLAKRGIIPKVQEKRVEEEVFAESYDDGEDLPKKSGSRAIAEKTELDKAKFMGYPGCPNKWNVYHECQIFCLNKWGSGKVELDPEYLRKHHAMMSKYGPLPDGWKEHYDPGTGRHYYWCTRTDRVSWLPPGHPKAKVTEAASAVREMLQSQVGILDKDDEDEEGQNMDLDSDMDSDNDDEDREIEERRRKEKDKRREEQDRYRSRDHHRERGGGRSRAGGGDRIDPMDPAAYSDVPRGTWSSGLETKDNIDS